MFESSLNFLVNSLIRIFSKSVSAVEGSVSDEGSKLESLIHFRNKVISLNQVDFDRFVFQVINQCQNKVNYSLTMANVNTNIVKNKNYMRL